MISELLGARQAVLPSLPKLCHVRLSLYSLNGVPGVRYQKHEQNGQDHPLPVQRKTIMLLGSCFFIRFVEPVVFLECACFFIRCVVFLVFLGFCMVEPLVKVEKWASYGLRQLLF